MALWPQAPATVQPFGKIMQKPLAIIAGAGPAGLTAAYELLRLGSHRVCILEATEQIGGLARTEVFEGNRIDIGGHRFFSKNARIMDWWQDFFPLCDEEGARRDAACMLLRSRKSRIFWNGRLFDYPVSLSVDTLRKLGPVKIVRAGAGYLRALLFPRKPEKSLEDFFVNRFGHELYATFFRDYTQKVWGVPCARLSPDWGAQRVKGLSLIGLLRHALAFKKDDLAQQDVETSLIGRFLYPPRGPGQLWEHVAERIRDLGGEIHLGHRLTALEMENGAVSGVIARSAAGGERHWRADALFSSMPVRDLAAALGPALSPRCQDLAGSLLYRDFFTVGLLLDALDLKEKDGTPLKDNWIYVHDERVQVGRLQFFSNWSPFMAREPGLCWVGMEYFCNESDPVWNLPEKEIVAMAAGELETLGIARASALRGGCRIHAPKAYPVYLGQGYDNFAEIRRELDAIPNLFLMGRNGMHRYNNMDHSMLSAMAAVKAACGQGGKEAAWEVNAEKSHVELGKAGEAGERRP